MTSPAANLQEIASRYKADPESVYNTWFIDNETRLKAFRSIRRGVSEVVRTIQDGTFGNDFKGSPLETVLDCITEQKQVFEGAAHPFYWKPKMRIPDIYENSGHQRAFGQFLECCLGTMAEDRLLARSTSWTVAKSRALAQPWQTSCISCIRRCSHPSTRPC